MTDGFAALLVRELDAPTGESVELVFAAHAGICLSVSVDDESGTPLVGEFGTSSAHPPPLSDGRQRTLRDDRGLRGNASASAAAEGHVETKFAVTSGYRIPFGR